MQKTMRKLSPKFEEILFWLVISLLIFIPLYQKFPLLEFKGLPVAIRLEDFLVLATVIVWLIYIFISGKIKTLFTNRIFQAVLLFWFIGLVSSFSAFTLIPGVSRLAVVFHFLRRVELLVLLFLGLSLTWDKRRFSLFLFTLVMVISAVNFYALGQKYLHFPAISTTNSELSKGKIFYLTPFDRVNSTFAGHYDLAVFLVLAFLLLLSFLVYFWDGRQKLLKNSRSKAFFIFLFLLLLVSFYVLISTAARLSFVALVGGVFLLFLILRKWKLLLLFGFFFLAVLAYPSQLRNRLILTFQVNIAREWNSYQAVNESQKTRSQLNIPTLPLSERRTETAEGVISPDIAPGEPTDLAQLAVYRSFEIRTKMEWPRAWRAFLRNPFLGSGYSSVDLATDNDFLRLLAEVGILGFLSFLLLLGVIFKELLAFRQKSRGFLKYYLTGILALLAAFVLNAFLIDAFEATKVASFLWLVLGVTLGLKDKIYA